MIKFNIPYLSGRESEFIKDVIENNSFQGDGPFSKRVESVLAQKFAYKKNFLTSSGTQALEMAGLLCNVRKGDEVIMPSYTFSSTANAFILRGAKVKFIDVNPDTMNWDENLLDNAITANTKALVPVHYAGVSCNMEKVMRIAKDNNLLVVEDAAQCIFSFFKDKALGSIGDFGILSFHETKNIQCGEGGAISINNPEFHRISDIIVEKGTNRKEFLNGEVDRYTWVNQGSSYLVNEMTSAFLFAQLMDVERVVDRRLLLWNRYYDMLRENENLELQRIPSYAKHNGHIFYIKVKNKEIRNRLMLYLKQKGIDSRTHFVPLHSSPFGLKNSEFIGEDKYTTTGYDRLLRLPMHFYLSTADVDHVVISINSFFKES